MRVSDFTITIMIEKCRGAASHNARLCFEYCAKLNGDKLQRAPHLIPKKIRSAGFCKPAL